MTNEIDELRRRASSTVTMVITFAGQLAQVLIEARVAQLRRAAQQSEAQARQIRAVTRARLAADAKVWQPALRRQWLREASIDDIAWVWRAASTWHTVDQSAAAARHNVAEELARRKVRVPSPPAPDPTIVDDLVAAVDDAYVETFESDVITPATTRADPVAEKEDRETHMAAEVRKAYPEDLANKVIDCRAWSALAYKLDQHQRAGHDPQRLLRAVPDFVSRAQTPAAYAARSVDRTVEDITAGRIHLGTIRPDPRPAAHSEASQDGAEKPATAAASGPPTPEELHLAARYVVDDQKGSAVLLGRRMHITHDRAAVLLEELEQRGVVGPRQPGRPRQVLVAAEDLPHMLPAMPDPATTATEDGQPQAERPFLSTPRTARPMTGTVTDVGR